MSVVTGTVCITGYYGIGKTSLIKRFLFDTFGACEETTVGASIFSKLIDSDDFKVHTTFWDTAGQEKFAALVPMYTRSADVIICAIDPTQPESFEYFKKNIESIIGPRVKNPPYVINIVVTKMDTQENDEFASSQFSKLFFFLSNIIEKYKLQNKIVVKGYLTSSKNGNNIKQCFLEAIEVIYKKKHNRLFKKENIILEKEVVERKEYCCNGSFF